MIKIVHFVNGAFTGATNIAIELCKQPLFANSKNCLVLNQKVASHDQQIRRLLSDGYDVRCMVGRNRLKTLLKLVSLLRKEKPDILVCHGCSEHTWGRWAGLIAGVPELVHVEHNSREKYSTLRQREMRVLARKTSLTVGCATVVLDRLNDLNCSARNRVVIENGINLEAFEASEYQSRADVVIMPARFVPQKDQKTVIQALAILKHRGVHLQLVFAGGGDVSLLEQNKALVTSKGLDDRVQFLGQIDDVPQRLMASKICVLATEYEGMPLVLCEAMAAGCAVVGSDVPGVREFIRKGKDGLLVPPKDPEALADVIQELIDNSQFAESLAEAGRERASKDFGLESMLGKYAKELKNLL